MRSVLAALLVLGLGSTLASADDYAAARRRMVKEQIEARGIRDARVLEAMRRVPRHEFVAPDLRPRAYEDTPLPILNGQTISQPYIVAAMSELAAIDGTARVLEIGTGSGYGAAVLGELAAEVFTIEIIERLANRAGRTLERVGHGNVRVRHGDGYHGWPAEAPFDAILVTAAAPRIPPALLAQLAPGGRLVIPKGDEQQELQVHQRTEQGIRVQSIFPVRFVPMTGRVRKGGTK